MILILANQAVFVTLSVVTIPPLAQGIFILTLNQADVIGDQLAKTVLTLFSTRVKMSPYVNPFIELAPVLDATP